VVKTIYWLTRFFTRSVSSPYVASYLFNDVRSELLKEFKFNFELNTIINFDLNIDIQDTTNFSSSSFHYPINNFYFSDIISKNSKIMAKCVEENMIIDQNIVVNQ
jgi:hypothetical protein